MYKFLRVTAIGDVKKKDGPEYRQVWFRPVAQLASGEEVYSNQQEKSRTIFEAHDDFKADPIYSDIKAGNIKVGSLVEGTIMRFETTPYQPEGFDKVISSYTCVVFSNENGLAYANRQLKANEACVVDANTGALTAPDQLRKESAMAQRATLQVG